MDADAPTEYAFEHPSPGRYLLTPAAMPIGAGRGYVSQKEIAVTQVGVGLGDGVSFEFGSLLPLWLTGEIGGVFALRATAALSDDVHVGGSLNVCASWAWANGVIGAAPTLDVTWGGPDAHLTARIAQGWLSTAEPDRTLPTALIVAGERRTGNHTAFVTEWWFIADFVGEPAFGPRRPTLLVPGGALRLLTRRLTLDVGLVPLLDADNTLTPVPWLDVTAYWGR